MTSETPILIVDDEMPLLQSLKRQLQADYTVQTAPSAKAAIKLLKSGTQFGVVVSDMMMPEINGLELLKQVRRLSPHTTRVMFTGFAEQDLITAAINQAGVFRFLQKPVSRELMTLTLDAALEKYHARVREVDLLEQTVAGSIRIFVDLLSASLKKTFAASKDLRHWSGLVAKQLEFNQAWQWDLAATLCSVGVLQLDRHLVDKIENGEELTDDEREAYRISPRLGRDLLSKVPRFKPIADIVCYQDYRYDGAGPEIENIEHLKGSELPLGARVLRILKDIYEAKTDEPLTEDLFADLEAEHSGRYDPAVFIAVRSALLQADDSATRGKKMENIEVTLDRLNIGDNLLANIVMAGDERVVLGAGVTLTESHIKKLRTVSKLHKLNEPFTVMRLVMS